MFYSFKGYKQDSLLLCMAKKTWKAFLEDVIYSFQKIKTCRAFLEDVIYSLVVPKNKNIQILSTDFKKTHEEQENKI